MRYNSVRKFTHSLMVILLGLEMLQTVMWLYGVNLAGAADGITPWKSISAERADRMCLWNSIVNFWL
jgi:hypothetical protein